MSRFLKLSAVLTNVILLNHGRVIESGNTHKIIDIYLNNLFTQVLNKEFIEEESSKEMFITKIQSLNQSSEAVCSFPYSEKILIDIDYKLNKWVPNIHAGFFVTDQRGRRVFTTENNTWDMATIKSGKLNVNATIPPNFLVAGEYLFTFYISIPRVKFIEWEEDILRISVT